MHELANQNSNLKIQHVKQHGAQEHINLDSKVENSLWIIGGAFKDFSMERVLVHTLELKAGKTVNIFPVKQNFSQSTSTST